MYITCLYFMHALYNAWKYLHLCTDMYSIYGSVLGGAPPHLWSPCGAGGGTTSTNDNSSTT